jgi:meso-butanediol dehydrogenase/(S,S)-butanediol dehydrogenase/diacetyl reductase
MKRETSPVTATVVIVLDGDTDAGYQLARRLLAEGRRVAAVARHPGDAVRVMHGHPADRVMAIAADTADQRQWGLVIERVMDRFGRIDTVVRAEDTALRASA